MPHWESFVPFAALMLVLGSALTVLPWVGRRGLLVGVYVGEERSDSEPARRIRQGWLVRMGLSSLVCLALLMAAAIFRPALQPLAPIALLAGFVGAYLACHRRAKQLAMASTAPAIAVLDQTPTATSVLPLLGMAAALVAGAGLAGHALVHYDELPQRIPVHFDLAGQPDRWAQRSPMQLLMLPLLTALIGGFVGFLALLTAHAKRSVRHTTDPSSSAAQQRFRVAISRFLGGITVLVTAMLTLTGVHQIDTARGAATLPRWLPLAITGTMIVFVMISIVYLMIRYGQGGARLERASASAPLTDGLADNRLWKLGLFYVNREDPSIIVEKRFGFGYTINLGNWRAVALFAGFFFGLVGVLIVAIVTS